MSSRLELGGTLHDKLMRLWGGGKNTGKNGDQRRRERKRETINSISNDRFLQRSNAITVCRQKKNQFAGGRLICQLGRMRLHALIIEGTLDPAAAEHGLAAVEDRRLSRSHGGKCRCKTRFAAAVREQSDAARDRRRAVRSEEHTSELQSRFGISYAV